MKSILYILLVFISVITASCNHIGKKSQTDITLSDDTIRERARFKVKLVTKPKNMNALYHKLGFKYSDIEEGEEQIISKLHKSSKYYNFNEELITLIENDPATLDYDFKAMQEGDYVSIVTSDDGNLRFYFWDTGMGGREGALYNICQYRSDGKIYVFVGSILELKYYEFLGDSIIEKVDNGENWDYLLDCEISKIHSLHANNGKTYYLVCTERNTIGDIYMGVEPISIENGKLKINSFFKSNSFEESENLYRYFNVRLSNYDNGFFNDRDDCWSNLYSFDKKTQTLYIPELYDYDTFSDQYALYHFNGEFLEYIGRNGGFWLYPGIRNFECLEALFFTKDFRVRIDKIKDGNYRYTSWKHDASVNSKPNIVIQNGLYNDEKKRYTFQNNGFKYVIEYDKYKELGIRKAATISIIHNGKQLLFQKEIL